MVSNRHAAYQAAPQSRLITDREQVTLKRESTPLIPAKWLEPKSRMKPTITPRNPRFSSGPCAKRPGWSLDALTDAVLGRSHRAKSAKSKLAEVIERSKKVLGIPGDYVLGIVP